MFVSAFDGVAWLRTEQKTGTIRLGGMLDHRTGLELIPSIVVALNDEVSWRVLDLVELTVVSKSGDRLIQAVCRLATAHGASLQVIYPVRTLEAVDPEPEVVPAQCRSV
jgi:hypothetical protein